MSTQAVSDIFAHHESVSQGCPRRISAGHVHHPPPAAAPGDPRQGQPGGWRPVGNTLRTPRRSPAPASGETRLIPPTAAALAAFSTGAFADEPDLKKGAKVFKKCKACHVIDKEKNKVGPHLVGLIGRKAASVEGYKYSKAMKAIGEEGLEWTEEVLLEYLVKPKEYVKGTKMAFGGLKKEKQRINLVAYLKENAKLAE